MSASFINPDSYAAYAGIGFIATVGIFLRLCRRNGAFAHGTPRAQLAALVETIGRDGAPVLAGGFTILAALLLTGSRGGIAASVLAVVAFIVLARRGGGREPRSWPMLILGLILGFAVVAGTGLLFGTAVADKIAGAGFFDANRLAVYRLTLQSIVDRPWLGWGYGTFVDVFPMYRDGSVAGSGTWSQAHNSYLEAMQGLGIVFGSIAIALVALPVLRCFRGALAHRGNATAPLVAVGAAGLVGAHALVDFSMQIQAVTLTVAALLGAGVAQAERSRISLDDGPRGDGPRDDRGQPGRQAATRRLADVADRARGIGVVRVRRLAGRRSRARRGADAGRRQCAAGPRSRRHARKGRQRRRGAGLAFPVWAARRSILPWRRSPRSPPRRGSDRRRN